MSTYMASASNIERKWYVVDAADYTQTDRSAGIGNHQIPGTSGNVPVKFVKSIIVPELPVEQIGKVIGIDSRRQRIFFFWGQNDFVAGFFCLVRDFLPVDGDRKQGQVNFVANAGARG